jgi:hypothetical protein
LSISTNSLLNAVYDWIDFIINPNSDIGTCTFTKGSKTVTGTDFITGAIISAGGYVKLNDNGQWYEIDSVDNETTLTLKYNYLNDTGTGDSSYTSDVTRIIVEEESTPAPEKNGFENPTTYLLIHPPTQIPVGRIYSANSTDDTGNLDYYQKYESTISIEELNGFGDKLLEIIEKSKWQINMDKMRELGISFLRNEPVTAIPANIENLFKKRFNVDLYICYTNKTTEDTSYIKNVNGTGSFDSGYAEYDVDYNIEGE